MMLTFVHILKCHVLLRCTVLSLVDGTVRDHCMKISNSTLTLLLDSPLVTCDELT